MDNNITHVTIPGGCTSKVQPLDVSLNKPFKACICGAWEEYMVRKAQNNQRCDNIPTASKSDIAHWIIDANKCLNAQTEMIRKSFLVCGISNSLDGSENHLIRMPEQLPRFVIPYGEVDEDTDPFQSSDSESSEADCD